MSRAPHFIVVSNRLPVTINVDAEEPQFQPSTGGLITALAPVLNSLPATWIGWTGTDYTPKIAEGIAKLHAPYKTAPVYLTESEREKYYLGFSNRVLWPLCHDMQTMCKFDATFWSAYQKVNEKFADVVTENSTPGDLVWVHDYHLMLVGDYLRSRNLGLQLAYFHHIPFPSPDIFANLPSGQVLLRALLRFDRLGFQTQRDKHNFVHCVRNAFGRKLTLRQLEGDLSVRFEGVSSKLQAAPVSIDFRQFARRAASPAVTARVAELEAALGNKRILLGVDRLDYTKGIQQRLSAFRLLLQNHPELHGTIALLQLVIPSREQVPEYGHLRTAIELQVSEINGAFGRPDWTPINYLHRTVSCEELIALYRLASVMLVTSIKDGMNLVAKEYCACKLDDSGALVLSRFTGASQELKVGALLVNPNDDEEIADACLAALTMSRFELQTRMSAMRRTVVKHDVWHWLASVLRDRNVDRLPSMVRRNSSSIAEFVA